MIKIGDETYYFDIDVIDKLISIPATKQNKESIITEEIIVFDNDGNTTGKEIHKTISEKSKEVDGAKYETIRLLIEIVLDYDEEIDDSLGSDRAFSKTNIPFKMAFNTLLNYGIIKEIE